MRSTFDASNHLPLKPAWFQILLSLASGPQHGYAIRLETEERTGGRVTLWPATLYGSIRDLEEATLIVEDDSVAAEDDDPRRRYYRITPRGREVLVAEADRLQTLVDHVRATGIAGDPP